MSKWGFSAIVKQENKDTDEESGLFQDLEEFTCWEDAASEAVNHNEDTLLDAVSSIEESDGTFKVVGSIECIYDLDDEFIPNYEIEIDTVERMEVSQLKIETPPKKRIMTMVFEVHDMEQAGIIWDSMGKGEKLLGCQIIVLADGNEDAELKTLEEAHYQLKEKLKKFTKTLNKISVS